MIRQTAHRSWPRRCIGSNPLSPSTPLETLQYDYNIRGWMLGANRDYAKSIDTISAEAYFGFDLSYDHPSFTVGSTNASYSNAQYNGNIGGMLWKSTGDDKIRKYDFSYDALNRLTAADFTQFHSNAFNTTAGIDYSVSNLSYDANGNILTHQQKGWKPGGSVMIDELQYNYLPHSNKLLAVLDNHNDTATRLGDFRSSKMYMTALGGTKTPNATDYSYDGNGNLVTDRNKDIGTSSAAGISYNHLNLPSLITVQGKGTIEFVYDALGNKLKKIVTDTTAHPDKMTTTLYMAGVYENDSLQFLAHEQGRIRYNSASKTFHWDYFLQDHLGNVRMVLTEEQKTTAYPAATMEDTLASTEQALYANLPETRSSLPGGYPVDNSYSDPNLKAARVNGNGQKIGPSITLKVMAGDKFHVRVSSWYRTVSGVPSTTSSPLTQLINALSAGMAPLSGGKVSSPELSSSSLFTGEAAKFLQSQDNYTTTKPKAFLNWILFDEQFNMVASSSGFEQVPEESVYSNTTTPKVYNHVKTNLPVHKNGYLYIYVSNETQGLDLFFDNLQVTHIAGPVVEETHYYPFGLTMAGISSMGFDKLESKNKYNGIELSEDLGIDIYDAQLRELDPQIGRWWQTDPEIEAMEMWSPYVSNFNNSIKFKDPLGNLPDGCCGFSDVVNAVNTVVAVAGGAANAWLTNQAGGVGRADYNQQNGLTDDQKSAGNLGQSIGDVVSIVTGAAEVVVAGGLEIATLGGATPGAIVVGTHGVSSMAMGTSNLIKGSTNGGNNSNNSNSSSSNNSSTLKQSKVEKTTKTENIGGKYTKKTEVKPGKDPGQSRAEYVRYKNKEGKVIRTQKFTYDRANKFQHKKPLRGGPEGRPQND